MRRQFGLLLQTALVVNELLCGHGYQRQFNKEHEKGVIMNACGFFFLLVTVHLLGGKLAWCNAPSENC